MFKVDTFFIKKNDLHQASDTNEFIVHY